MDNFIEEAMRTSSPNFFGEKISKQVFISYLEQLVFLGQDLDAIKKTLFYGKEPNHFSERWAEEDPPVQAEGTLSVDIIHSILGVITEATELADALVQALAGKQDIDLANLYEESGDIKWYLAMLARALNHKWHDDEEMVIAKLKARYPEKFTKEHAENRNLDKERQVIENS